jgi:2-polyprenyl-6-methoxyphenol hydroxylase-like FAD-dependent oxidoreductase
MQFVTDRLEWLFGVDASFAAAARNAGLRAVNGVPWARQALSSRAMR